MLEPDKTFDPRKSNSYIALQKKLHLALGNSDVESLNAQKFIEQNPEILLHKSLVIDLAYEEFCLKNDANEKIDVREFAGRFPGFEKSILHQIAFHKLMEEEQKRFFKDLEDDELPQVGDEYLGFKLISELGRGAFARVFHAFDQSLDRDIVLKICLYGDQEAKKLAKLSHENIVPVYSVNFDPDSELTAICMPFLGQTTLLDLIDLVHQNSPSLGKGNISRIDSRTQNWKSSVSNLEHSEYVARMLLESVSALEYVHSQGYCHGDIKPSNILIADNETTMLLDFNLAHLKGQDQVNGGTLPYMAPEQLHLLFSNEPLDHKIDERSDLFQLGVTFYEFLTGRLPFGDSLQGNSVSSVAEQLYEKQKEGFIPIRELEPEIDKTIATIIESCIRFEVEERPSSSGSLVSKLQSYSKISKKILRRIYRHSATLAVTMAIVFLLSATYYVQASSHLENQLEKGLALQADGKHLEAIGLFSQVLREKPDSDRVLFRRAFSYAENGEFRRAIDDLLPLSERGENGITDALAAYCMFFAKEPRDRVISRFQQAMSKDYKNEYILSNLGYLYLRSSSLETARKYLLEAADRNPTVLATFISLSELEVIESYQLKKKPNLTFIEKAIEISSEFGETYFHAAELYSRAAIFSDGKEQEEYSKKAIESCDIAVQKGVNHHRLQQLIRIQKLLVGESASIEFEKRSKTLSNFPKVVRIMNPVSKVKLESQTFPNLRS